MYISRNRIERIKEKADLVGVIEKYVQLQDTGMCGRKIGRCPFCNRPEKFLVAVPKKIWFCFGCGTGGTVITFTMKMHELSFDDACIKIEEEAWDHQSEKRESPSLCSRSEGESKTVSIN